jgi:hypothetical protein
LHETNYAAAACSNMLAIGGCLGHHGGSALPRDERLETCVGYVDLHAGGDAAVSTSRMRPLTGAQKFVVMAA